MILALVSAGCKGSTKSVKPEIAVLRACERPAWIPEKNLTMNEVERYWAKDRQNLVNCGVSKAALIKWLKRNGLI